MLPTVAIPKEVAMSVLGFRSLGMWSSNGGTLDLANQLKFLALPVSDPPQAPTQ